MERLQRFEYFKNMSHNQGTAIILSPAQRTGEFRAARAVNTLCHPSLGSNNNMKALIGGFGTFS